MKVFVIIIIFQFLGLNAQTLYHSEQNKASMTVTGTSTIHDWELKVEDIKHTGSITMEGNKLLKINQLDITVAVNSLKSGKDLMDNKTYEALNEADHPAISFNLISAILKGNDTATSTGELTIAGKTRKVTMNVRYKLYETFIEFQGELTLKISDYEITPPTVLMGTIKTGDEVTISFSIPFPR